MEARLGEDLTDSASSPLKSAHQTNKEEVASDAKKKLFEATGGEQQGTPPPPPQYLSPRDKKKMKKLGQVQEKNNATAASGSEVRQDE